VHNPTQNVEDKDRLDEKVKEDNPCRQEDDEGEIDQDKIEEEEIDGGRNYHRHPDRIHHENRIHLVHLDYGNVRDASVEEED
jgi:hypothetical protein